MVFENQTVSINCNVFRIENNAFVAGVQTVLLLLRKVRSHGCCSLQSLCVISDLHQQICEHMLLVSMQYVHHCHMVTVTAVIIEVSVMKNVCLFMCP